MSDKITKQIPKISDINAVLDIPAGSSLGGELKEKIDQLHYLLIAIVASVVISGIAVVVSALGLFLDQMHYNNAAYSEYSQQVKQNNDIQTKYDDKIDQMLKNQQILTDKIK